MLHKQNRNCLPASYFMELQPINYFWYISYCHLEYYSLPMNKLVSRNITISHGMDICATI